MSISPVILSEFEQHARRTLSKLPDRSGGEALWPSRTLRLIDEIKRLRKKALEREAMLKTILMDSLNMDPSSTSASLIHCLAALAGDILCNVHKEAEGMREVYREKVEQLVNSSMCTVEENEKESFLLFAMTLFDRYEEDEGEEATNDL